MLFAFSPRLRHAFLLCFAAPSCCIFVYFRCSRLLYFAAADAVDADFRLRFSSIYFPYYFHAMRLCFRYASFSLIFCFYALLPPAFFFFLHYACLLFRAV